MTADREALAAIFFSDKNATLKLNAMANLLAAVKAEAAATALEDLAAECEAEVEPQARAGSWVTLHGIVDRLQSHAAAIRGTQSLNLGPDSNANKGEPA